MIQQSTKVSLIPGSVDQLIYVFLSRCCLLQILPITLQRHPCPLGRQNYSVLQRPMQMGKFKKGSPSGKATVYNENSRFKRENEQVAG